MPLENWHFETCEGTAEWRGAHARHAPLRPVRRESTADDQVAASAAKCTVDRGMKLTRPVVGPAHGIVEVSTTRLEDDGRALSGFEE